jgi:hypothetical protein
MRLSPSRPRAAPPCPSKDRLVVSMKIAPAGEQFFLEAEFGRKWDHRSASEWPFLNFIALYTRISYVLACLLRLQQSEWASL